MFISFAPFHNHLAQFQFFLIIFHIKEKPCLSVMDRASLTAAVSQGMRRICYSINVDYISMLCSIEQKSRQFDVCSNHSIFLCSFWDYTCAKDHLSR